MRRLATFTVSISLLLAAVTLTGAQESSSIAGFSDAAATEHRAWVEKFRQLPSPDRLRETIQRLSARPHHVGSAYDKEVAEWILAQFKAWGWDAQIEEFDALFPTPKTRRVEMVAPTRVAARLQEPAVPQDPTSSQQGEQLPSYNAYSIDGDVTAPLVYVNYGIPADYEELERLGVSVKGAIVIAKYGQSWRGIKPKVAAEHGAVGCLIYSDPRDDGYFEGDTFPGGPWRPEQGVQRGSVMDMPLYPGDPLTPGIGATPSAKRLALASVKTLTKIPVLPISYGDAAPLLRALRGPVAPASWRGALGFTYHVGPGPAKVRLQVASSWERRPVYNVIARIQGALYPDEWIVRGNHHDAWVNGAEDPISGMAAELEEARALGELLKQGWRPTRTIVYAAWGAEEPGLIGSTEWAEAHADELRQKAVAYVNSDSNGRGFLAMSGSHLLEPLVNDVARRVDDPETELSVWKRLRLQQIAQADSQEERQKIRQRADLRLGALGSGSDYTAFLDHLGIASLNLSFGGEAEGGIYHSIYDDFYWYSRFGDPDFVYGRALAQTAGTVVMRLADAELLPYDFTALADTVVMYLDEVKELAASQRRDIEERNRQIEEGVFAAIRDPRHPRPLPVREEVPPHINLAPLENAVDTLQEAAARYRKAIGLVHAEGGTALEGGRVAAVNRELLRAERLLTTPEGLPERAWYKHQIYAPGFYTGYGVKTLPAVREAIEQKEWTRVDAGVATVAKVLEAEAALIGRAAEQLEALAP
ncbi:MAG: M28 family metallopeptidase [Vicinamibacteraceae bacterium]